MHLWHTVARLLVWPIFGLTCSGRCHPLLTWPPHLCRFRWWWSFGVETGSLVKLDLSFSQRYLKTLGSTPWSEWASDIEALPEHLTDWQPTTPCHYQWSIISWDQNLEPDVWHVHYEVCTIVVNQWCFTVFLTHYIDGIVYIEPNSWHMYREDS